MTDRKTPCYNRFGDEILNHVILAGRIPERNRDLPGAIGRLGLEVAQATTGEEALRLIRGEKGCRLVVAGIPAEIAPRAFLAGVRKRFPEIHGVLLLERPDPDPPMADDFLDLSGKSTAEIVAAVRGLLTSRRVAAPEIRLLGTSREMDRLRRTIDLVAPTSMTALVTGESGTGKEVVARLIHEKSRRREQAFVAVNCAALPEGVLESELFGHEKGAFTGATARREGRFELAHKGTLFLDEIGDMPIQTQSKLLRVLEEKRFLRVGGVRDVVVDVRLLAATNADLEAAVQGGRFREDLYYRLNVLQIHIPPLRERREDIPALIEEFAKEASADHGTAPIRFTDDALRALSDFHWPGNVRQLRNLIEKVTILEQGNEVDSDAVARLLGERFVFSRHLPIPVREGSASADREMIYQTLLAIRRDIAEIREAIRLGRSRAGGPVPAPPDSAYRPDEEVVELVETPEPQGRLTAADFEREAIRRALSRSGGNRRRAAEILEIGERTLYRKIKKYGLDD